MGPLTGAQCCTAYHRYIKMGPLNKDLLLVRLGSMANLLVDDIQVFVFGKDEVRDYVFHRRGLSVV